MKRLLVILEWLFIMFMLSVIALLIVAIATDDPTTLCREFRICFGYGAAR